ncbi:MAG: hypothetical protein HHAS10_02300 [Candidatus Altimarinota bacterium]
MYNPKSNYNNATSVKVYTEKRGLMKSEESIFELFSFNKEIKILDLGCGGGRTTAALYERGFKNIVGIDFAENLIHGAKNEYPHLADIFSVGDATHLDQFHEQEFDLVFFSFNGMDYIPNRDERLKAYNEIHRVLKPGGMYVFSSHNKWCFPINRLLLKIQILNLHRIFSEYWWAGQTFGKMLTYFSTESALERDLVNSGFRKICVIPNTIHLYPFFDPFPYYLFKKTEKIGK